MSEQENKTVEEVNTDENDTKTVEEVNTDEGVIELEWEEVKEIFQIRASLVEVESTLSAFMLNFEKRKAAFLHRARELETAMYSAGNALRSEKEVDPNSTYELRLPEASGQKAYFVRKDD